MNKKYRYNGISLSEYCKNNNINKSIVYSRIYQMQNSKKYENYTDQEIVDSVMESACKRQEYKYNGIPLCEYCKNNNINISVVYARIQEKRNNKNYENYTDQEIVDLVIESICKRYKYNGKSLSEYCKNNNIKRTTIYNAIYRKKKSGEYENYTGQEILNAVLERKRYKYYYLGISLKQYCDENNLNYMSVLSSVSEQRKNDSFKDLTDEELVEVIIKRHEKRLKIDKINKIFDKLKVRECNVNEMEEICHFLKIDFKNVEDLVNVGFSYYQAISMIWYFSDEKTNNDYKMITNKKIKEIFTLINNLKDPNKDINQFTLSDLVMIYKSELYDSRNDILFRQKDYIYSVIYSLCKVYEIKVDNDNVEDFKNEIISYLLMAIDKNYINTPGQIVRYIDISIKRAFGFYLKKNKIEFNELILDAPKYCDRGRRTQRKSKLDYIANPNNQYENIENSSFSLEMMRALSSLSPEDLSFIVLKYQKDYSDSQLARYFNLTFDEIKEKEIEILSLLKNNSDIKVLIKK